MKFNDRWLFVLLGFSCLLHFSFLGWGVPDHQRTSLVLTEEQRNEEFYGRLARARDALYENFKWANPTANEGYARKHGLPVKDVLDEGGTKDFLLNSLGSYLVRSLDSDEQKIFVALAGLKSGKDGNWIPAPSHYGGAYLYPLAVILKATQVVGLLDLVPDIT